MSFKQLHYTFIVFCLSSLETGTELVVSIIKYHICIAGPHIAQMKSLCFDRNQYMYLHKFKFIYHHFTTNSFPCIDHNKRKSRQRICVRACCRLFRRMQHVFDKNAIPSGGGVDEHMGHRADQLAILNDRGAAHE